MRQLRFVCDIKMVFQCDIFTSFVTSKWFSDATFALRLWHQTGFPMRNLRLVCDIKLVERYDSCSSFVTSNWVPSASNGSFAEQGYDLWHKITEWRIFTTQICLYSFLHALVITYFSPQGEPITFTRPHKKVTKMWQILEFSNFDIIC